MNFFYNAPIERGAPGRIMPSANRPVSSLTYITKNILLGVKLAAVLLLTTCLQVSAKVTTAQKLSISFHNGSLEKLFAEIEKKTQFVFFYDAAILKGTKPVTVEMKEASVDEILRAGLKGQALDYSINDKTIFVKRNGLGSTIDEGPGGGANGPREVRGTVLADDGTPLSGATIKLKDGKIAAITDDRGSFRLKNISSSATIQVSFTGYIAKEINIDNSQASITVALNRSSSKLDEVQVIAYGTTTQRLSTGDVVKVTSKEIEQQPVSNPLAALEGRVPGLVITQTTGAPGGGYSVQIRGANSIANSNNPFYVVDGVPYNSQIPSLPYNSSGLLNSTLQGGNPLNYINPLDIESIEILKDADATAIYGSRAANGAILITTKKGKFGKMRATANVSSGFQQPARDIKLLNTQQYLSVRHQAFQNDNVSPNSANAPDLVLWDTSRFTNWSKVLTGNTAHYSSANVSVSGGNNTTKYLIGIGYNDQGTPFPTLHSGDGKDKKISAHVNLSAESDDKKLKITFTGSYVSDKNTVQSEDFSNDRFYETPNAPRIFNQDGSLNWEPLSSGQSGTWTNPYGQLNSRYNQNTSNLVSNAIVGYSILPNWEIRSSFGYNSTRTEEIQSYPTTVFDPGYYVNSGYSNFNSINSNGWIIEPQTSYKLTIFKGILQVLVGSTFEENKSNVQTINANGFISDALIENPQAASSISISSNSTQYKYDAIFGRVNYNWNDKYIISLNGRRDGSSRFGPGRQFGNFGSVGGAWVFSNESFFQKNLSFLSFGKLRGSYGTAGNDGIGDYQYLDIYNVTNTNAPYGGIQGLSPTTLFNPDLAWEINKKLEGGIELGFFKDRITLFASVYRNRSGNQLVSTPVSLVTGFQSIPSNLPALVQNSGTELVLKTINFRSKDFSWLTSLNLSIPRNKLISYPDLTNSVYSNTLIVGQPLNIKRLYHLLGVNDTTGIYQFTTFHGDATYRPNFNTDRTSIINTAPKYYGGLENSFKYKSISLDILFQFVKQTGQNLLGAYPNFAGEEANIPTSFLNYWHQPGDKAVYQKLTQSFSSAAKRAWSYAKQSDFAYSDASFIRLKNVAVSWELPDNCRKKLHLENARIYAQGQNLLTITHYNGIDPESQGTILPPMRVYTIGMQVIL